jgi:multiple sugar transport system substrate-binding protein
MSECKLPAFRIKPFYACLFTRLAKSHGRVGYAVPWFGWLALFFLLLFVSGCRVSPQGASTLKLAYWGSVDEVRLLTPLLDQFERDHPGVHIQRVHIPQQYVQKLHFMAASHLLPDVMMLNSWVLPTYAQAGQLMPVNAPMQDVYPQAIQALSWHGTVWAYPRDVSNLVVYANVDLLRQRGLRPPTESWTMADVSRYASRLKPLWTLSAQNAPPLFWLPWVWAYGGNVWGKTPTGVVCVLPASAYRGIKAFAQLKQPDATGYSVAPTLAQAGSTPMAQWFIQQKLAFLVSGRWTEPLLRKQATFQWITLPLPAGPAGSHSGIDATGYGVSASTRYPEAAKALAQFLTQASSLRQLSQSGLIVPARSSVAEAVLGRQSTFLRVIATGVPTQSSPQWQALAEQMTENLQPVFNGSASVTRAIQRIQQQHQQLTGISYPSCQ